MTDERPIINEPRITTTGTFSRAPRNQQTPSGQPSHSVTPDRSVQLDSRPVLLFVITQAMWKDPQRYIAQLAEYFGTEYQIHIIYGAFEFTGKNMLQERIKSIGGHVHPISTLRRKNVFFSEISSVIEMWKIVKKLRPSIVHYHDGKAALLGSMAVMVAGSGARTVSTIHSFIDVRDQNGFTRAVVQFFTKLSYGRARHIIVRDEYSFTRAQAMFGPRKVTLVLPGIHTLKFVDPQEKLKVIARETSEAVRKHMQEPGVLVIGNIAPLDADQGIAYTLQALRLILEQGVSFIYIHYGEGDQRKLLSLEVGRLGLQDRVLFQGSDKLAVSYLPMFDIVVHPTVCPGFPEIILDVALASRALIISDVVGVSTAINRSVEAMMVPAKDARAIADAIIRLAQNPAERHTLGNALNARIVHDYDRDRMFKQTADVYNG